MRALLTSLPVLAALAACQTATGPMGYGSALDRIRVQPAVAADTATPEGQQRAEQIALARSRSEALRSRLALETDRMQRMDILWELQGLGDTVRKLESGGSASPM